MKYDPQILALAGLLHEIGAFSLRAGEAGTRVPAEVMDAEDDEHVLPTADFVEKYVPAAWRAAVRAAVAGEPGPAAAPDRVVQLAAQLATGEGFGSGGEPLTGAIHPRRLLSIFSLINAENDTLKVHAYWPLSVLRMDEEAIFPADEASREDDGQSYRRLWRDFKEGVEKLKDAHEEGGDLAAYLESMQLLMQRYTWCQPSASCRTRPDISLFDHSRMTGALAAVLADSEDQTLDDLIAAPSVAQPLASLIGGDISGVQDFIYTISSRGAAGALRGRSFYLQLLTEVIARFLLQALDLPITNLVYAGGGNFYLLARPSDPERLSAIQAHLSHVLLQAHGGELFVALAGEPLRGVDFFNGEISRAWGRVTEQFQAVKRQRFSELGDDLAHLFEPQGQGGNEEKACQVCGQEHPGTKPEPGSQSEENPEGIRKCPPCLQFEALGEMLRQARYLHLRQITPAGLESAAGQPDWSATLAALGWQAQVSAKPPAPARNSGVAWALHDEAVGRLEPGPALAVGRKLLVNVTPIMTEEDQRDALEHNLKEVPEPGRIKTFDVMGAQARGIRRLGVLRMDVDDMGRLFAEGLGQAASLSRVASLSFAVSLFFEGWVEHLAEAQGDNRVYSIYSGGDDLFFVGSWDKIVELARSIRVHLGRYAGGHPDIHASAGIALIGGKYPLYQAARDAGEAEAQAKALHWGVDKHKDAVSFLNLTLPWQRFGLEDGCGENFETSHGLMHFLVRLSGNGASDEKGAPKATLQKLLRQYEAYADVEKKRRLAGVDKNRAGSPQVLWGPWMWRTFYLLRQLARRYRQGPEMQKEIVDLSDLFAPESTFEMNWIGLSARWTELITRRES